jgi:hypothetical protein
MTHHRTWSGELLAPDYSTICSEQFLAKTTFRVIRKFKGNPYYSGMVCKMQNRESFYASSDPRSQSNVWLNPGIRAGNMLKGSSHYEPLSSGSGAESEPNNRGAQWCVMVVVARDGIEPPTPAFSGPLPNCLSGLKSVEVSDAPRVMLRPTRML